MSTGSNSNILKKTVSFSEQEFYLYSYDGITWSSRVEELDKIRERHEDERQKIGDFHGRFARKPMKGSPKPEAGAPSVESPTGRAAKETGPTTASKKATTPAAPTAAAVKGSNSLNGNGGAVPKGAKSPATKAPSASPTKKASKPAPKGKVQPSKAPLKPANTDKVSKTTAKSKPITRKATKK